eukprot:8824532-Pyramimonas_sp.AAC.1
MGPPRPSWRGQRGSPETQRGLLGLSWGPLRAPPGAASAVSEGFQWVPKRLQEGFKVLRSSLELQGDLEGFLRASWGPLGAPMGPPRPSCSFTCSGLLWSQEAGQEDCSHRRIAASQQQSPTGLQEGAEKALDGAPKTTPNM